MRTALAFLAATIGPALFLIGPYLYGSFQLPVADDGYLWVRVKNFSLMTLMASAAFVVFLGLPAFLLLRRKQLIRWWSAIGSGFALAALPMAVFTWPLRHSHLKGSSIINGVQTMVDGVPTSAGWLQYAGGVGMIGGLGAIGGLCFWLVWRHEPRQRVPGGLGLHERR